MTLDHNPNTNDSERVRVEAAGGRIEKMHWGEQNKRVMSYDSSSGLAMTRAFGDFNFPGVRISLTLLPCAQRSSSKISHCFCR